MSAPLELLRTHVKPAWVDSFGHMNMAMYVLVCDHATGAFWDHVNGGVLQDARAGAEYAVVEAHVNYLAELRVGQALRITTQLIGADEKRFRLFHTLYHASEDRVAATNEVMALAFDLHRRASMHFHDDVRQRLQALLAEHTRLPLPANAGRAIGAPRRR